MLSIIQNQLPIFISDKYSIGYISHKDKKDMFEMYSNEKIAKYVARKTHTSIEDTEEFIDLIFQRMKNGNNIYLGIFDISNEKFIGIIRFLEKEDPNIVTIGYALNEKYWGKGIVVDVLKVLFKLIALDGKYSVIRATVRPENIKSQRCLEKLGFEFVESFYKESNEEADIERMLYYKKI